ncbi:Citrate synthase [Gemmata obscuriglobus]|uniref:Citrate synthase n=1 Tax=Gemmata obscuriglobus TaxID=114 RepID=A0A2Z3GMX4_9BACT|nr:citrate synthase [Gemmata obscuriglobus]AWM35569.1 citrate synthase [Gemmata obscuriglobus]QEG31912.1 Citrate synthase [Gemmata obscuriglobus]VTS11258.1 citrate synthase : Citrate synthase OS=Nodularia spumigena CCY9414 GN=NSP_39540 PE=3 SV=1: Citrate_synt [Gemmata obscuriglobus UQM 2246]
MSTEIEYKPGLEDVPAAKSAVSFLDGKKAVLEYRGIPVEVLAKESSFEEVSWLLVKGDLPTQKQLAEFDHDLRQRRAIHFRLKDLIKCMPADGHPMDALHAGVAALGMFYPCPTVSNPAKNWDATCRLIAALPTLVAAFARVRRGEEILDPRSDLDHAGNFYYMLFGKEPSPATRKVLDACLILHAEHQMNASTFTARVTGSTLATPYHTIASAIGSLSGPLHGGANEEALRQFEEIGGPEQVKGWLDAKRAVDSKYKVMGMGHRVYKVKDARATVLQEIAEHMFAETARPKTYETALELERLCAGIYGPKGIYPNVDFYSGVVYQSLGIPTDVFTPIFAIARVSGWLAHWTEQLVGNRIFRPEQISIGKTDVKYVPLEQRA